MATTRVLADFIWDENTEIPATVQIDVSNEDSLSIQAIFTGESGPNWIAVPEGSLDGVNWCEFSFLEGGQGWDAYHTYYDNSIGANVLLSAPTFAVAPLKWFRLRLNPIGGSLSGGPVRYMVFGGVIGR